MSTDMMREALEEIARELISEADNLSPVNDVHPAPEMREWATRIRQALASPPPQSAGVSVPGDHITDPNMPGDLRALAARVEAGEDPDDIQGIEALWIYRLHRDHDAMCEAETKFLQRLRDHQPTSIPEGWQLVPKELTAAIACALEECDGPEAQTQDALNELVRSYSKTWAAALSASPSPQSAGASVTMTTNELMQRTPAQVAAYFIPDIIHVTAGCTSRQFRHERPPLQIQLNDILCKLLERAFTSPPSPLSDPQ